MMFWELLETIKLKICLVSNPQRYRLFLALFPMFEAVVNNLG